MNEKMYLIHLDILGFRELTKEIGFKKGIDQRKVRENFIKIIKERIKLLEKKGKITGKKYGESDDWLLVTDSLDKLFTCISEILDHYTDYINYEKIPLELAIGTGEYDKWAKFDGVNLIVEDPTLEFYNTKIIGHYHKWYKKRHNNQSPKSTFIVLTESAYYELEPFDRKKCQKIEHMFKKNKSTEEVITYYIVDVDKFQQRGRVFEFLEKIEQTGNKWYGRIDEVYIPPLNYKDITEVLKEKRFIIITGTQEYGKTYTAVKLMWEYYKKGYEPRWIKGGELAERIQARQRLENITAEMKPMHIIYFEDPFGKRKYEMRESLEREFGTIMDNFKKCENTFVIITSREEVFKEFIKEKLFAKDLRDIEKKLSIKKPSYNYKRRKEILLKWAEVENCIWFGYKKLKELVLESIENEKNLPTLLSIKNFALATIDIKNEIKLRKEIKEKSKDTAKAFAKEIKNMNEGKIIFLLILLVLDYCKIVFVKKIYDELLEELNLKDVWEFDSIINWFKNDKINVITDNIRFSHPSYSESLEYLLVENGSVTSINKKIFCKILNKLSDENEAVSKVAWTVIDQFDKLPEDVRNKILIKLSGMNGSAWIIALHLQNEEFFNNFNENVLNKLLIRLSKKEESAESVSLIITGKSDKISENFKTSLLFNLSKHKDASKNIAFDLLLNYEKISKDQKNLLYNLSKDKNSARGVAWALGLLSFMVPQNELYGLLLNISDMDEVGAYIAPVVSDYFDQFPEEIRNKLLLNLSDQKEASMYVATLIAKNFAQLPENIRNLLDGLRLPLERVTLYLSEQEEHKEMALKLISNAFTKYHPVFLSEILKFLYNSGDKRIRAKVIKLRNTMLNDKKKKIKLFH